MNIQKNIQKNLQNKDLMEKVFWTFDAYLDERIRTFGLYNTIQYLRYEGFSDEDLKDLNFDEELILLSKNMTDEEREEADKEYVM